MRDWVLQALWARETGSECPFVIMDKTQNKVVGCTRYLDISQTDRCVGIKSPYSTSQV